MPRKLKVFKTSIGFFDLAVAAPSRAAALRAWGANANLFQQGFAEETSDAKIAAAALAKPGVVLQRPVGSTKPFTEHATLPTDLPSGTPPRRAKAATRPRTNAREKPRASAAGKPDLQRERAQQRALAQRERQRQKQAAAEAKARARREQAERSAAAALARAERRHEQRAAAIAAERARIERRSQAEEDRWRKEKEKHEAALRRARAL